MARRIDTQAEIDWIRLADQGSDPASPAAGYKYFYAKSGGIYLINSAGTVVGPFIGADGWITAAAMTYASADDPTYTATMSGDVSGTYGVGMRIKLSQSTGGTKYFIITKVAVSGDTTLTLYGGTDYNLENEAISNPYYSMMKVPFGFPPNPTKWMVEVKDTSIRTQATPVQNTWYLINAALTITIPIGEWFVNYQATQQSADASNGSWITNLTLSTANNAESDIDFTTRVGVADADGISVTTSKDKYLTIATKTPYYLLIRTETLNMDNIYIRGDVQTTILRAVCAYL